jgi:hypothetical protein
MRRRTLLNSTKNKQHVYIHPILWTKNRPTYFILLLSFEIFISIISHCKSKHRILIVHSIKKFILGSIKHL